MSPTAMETAAGLACDGDRDCATMRSTGDEDASVGGAATAATTGRALGAMKFLNYQSVIAVIALMVCASLVGGAHGLKCHMCGQYNEGVGSITPCLNYSDEHAHLYLKECSKKSEKFCVKYASELSIVRDCATECVEKEIWETQTYCCNHDGCNGSSRLELANALMTLMMVMTVLSPLLGGFVCSALMKARPLAGPR